MPSIDSIMKGKGIDPSGSSWTLDTASEEEKIAINKCNALYLRNISILGGGSAIGFFLITQMSKKSPLYIKVPLVILGGTLGALTGFTLATRSCLLGFAELPKESPLKRDFADIVYSFNPHLQNPPQSADKPVDE